MRGGRHTPAPLSVVELRGDLGGMRRDAEQFAERGARPHGRAPAVADQRNELRSGAVGVWLGLRS